MKGKFNIGRYSNTNEMFIEIIDEASGIQFVHVKTDCETLMRAITGMGYSDCEFEFHPKYVGYKRENKTIWIETPDFSVNKKQAVEILKPYEVDGWSAEISDILNNHKYQKREGKNGYSVGFYRFVKPNKVAP
jgi:hypothetical protein